MPKPVKPKPTKEEPSFEIAHEWDERLQRILERNGAPLNAVLTKGKFDLEEVVTKSKLAIPGSKVRMVTPARQLAVFQRIKLAPLKGNYLYVISSFPSDARAKQVGLYLMHLATVAHLDRLKKATVGTASTKQAPKWMPIFGNFDKNWLSKEHFNPSFMVISNVTDDATPQKIEKMRDTIEAYEDRPRVVVTASADPLHFSLERLKVSPNAVMFIGPSDSTSVGL